MREGSDYSCARDGDRTGIDFARIFVGGSAVGGVANLCTFRFRGDYEIECGVINPAVNAETCVAYKSFVADTIGPSRRWASEKPFLQIGGVFEDSR